MAFDSTIVNFLTVGDFATDPSYELPFSQQLTTSSDYGLVFANSGAGSAYELQTSGNMLAVMALQNEESYGIVFSVPQIGGGLITRQLTGSGSISISNAGGVSGNPILSVTPATTVQLVNISVGGTNIGSARSTLDFIAGTNMGINATDSGSVTRVTFNSISDPVITSGPFVITQAESGLEGATNLGTLSTGYVFSTVTEGVAALSTVSASAFATLDNTQTFTGVNTFSQAPVMSGASISSGSIPVTAVAGSIMTLSTAQTVSAIKTFSAVPVFSSSINIPTGASVGYVLVSDSSGNASWSSAGSGDVTLVGTNVFTGTNSFKRPILEILFLLLL